MGLVGVKGGLGGGDGHKPGQRAQFPQTRGDLRWAVSLLNMALTFDPVMLVHPDLTQDTLPSLLGELVSPAGRCPRAPRSEGPKGQCED